MVDGLWKACSPCLAEDVDEDHFVKACEGLEKKLPSLKVTGKVFEQRCKPVLQNVRAKIFEYLDENFGAVLGSPL